MIFSKHQFLSHSDKGIQKLLSKHLDSLHGLKVIFPEEDKRFGTTEPYLFDGIEWVLYPVLVDWCEMKMDV